MSKVAGMPWKRSFCSILGGQQAHRMRVHWRRNCGQAQEEEDREEIILIILTLLETTRPLTQFNILWPRL